MQSENPMNSEVLISFNNVLPKAEKKIPPKIPR